MGLKYDNKTFAPLTITKVLCMDKRFCLFVQTYVGYHNAVEHWLRYTTALTDVSGFTSTSLFTPHATDCFPTWARYNGQLN